MIEKYDSSRGIASKKIISCNIIANENTAVRFLEEMKNAQNKTFLVIKKEKYLFLGTRKSRFTLFIPSKVV